MSQALFDAAQARHAAAVAPTPIQQRVRVRLGTCDEAILIVFASVEALPSKRKGCMPTQCLFFRRGSDILATVPLASLHTQQVSARVLGLGAKVRDSAAVTLGSWVHFESTARMAKFVVFLA